MEEPVRTYYTLRDSEEYGFEKDSIIHLTRKQAELLVHHGYIIPLHVAIRQKLKKDNCKYIPWGELKFQKQSKSEPSKPSIKRRRRKR